MRENQNTTLKKKYSSPTAVVLEASDELLDRESLIEVDSDNLDFGYDDFWQ